MTGGKQSKEGEFPGVKIIKKAPRDKASPLDRIPEIRFIGEKKTEPKVFKGACRVCGGDVMEKIVTKFDPKMGPMIIGPGSRQQFYDVREGYYCQSCGIKYEFVSTKE